MISGVFLANDLNIFVNPGWNFEGGGFDNLCTCVFYNYYCMFSIGGFRGALIFIVVWWGTGGFSNFSKLLVWGYAW